MLVAVYAVRFVMRILRRPWPFMRAFIVFVAISQLLCAVRRASQYALVLAEFPAKMPLRPFPAKRPEERRPGHHAAKPQSSAQATSKSPSLHSAQLAYVSQGPCATANQRGGNGHEERGLRAAKVHSSPVPLSLSFPPAVTVVPRLKSSSSKKPKLPPPPPMAT